jgi:hypothetical protein
MRTLLDESLPPNCMDEQNFSPPQPETQEARTFPQTAVLATLDDLVEVGVGRTVIVTPGVSSARQANDTLERDMASCFENPETQAACAVAQPVRADLTQPKKRAESL